MGLGYPVHSSINWTTPHSSCMTPDTFTTSFDIFLMLELSHRLWHAVFLKESSWTANNHTFNLSYWVKKTGWLCTWIPVSSRVTQTRAGAPAFAMNHRADVCVSKQAPQVGGMTQPGARRQVGEAGEGLWGMPIGRTRMPGAVQDKAEARSRGKRQQCARSHRPGGRAGREEGAAGSMCAGRSCPPRAKSAASYVAGRERAATSI